MLDTCAINHVEYSLGTYSVETYVFNVIECEWEFRVTMKCVRLMCVSLGLHGWSVVESLEVLNFHDPMGMGSGMFG